MPVIPTHAENNPARGHGARFVRHAGAAAARLLLAMAALPAWAAETQSIKAQAAVSPTMGMLQVFGGLLLVLLVVAGLAWALKRFGVNQQNAAGIMKIIGGVAVGQRERVVLIEVGATWLVVGVAPGQVRALHSMPRTENISKPRVTPSGPPGFAGWLKHMTEKTRP